MAIQDVNFIATQFASQTGKQFGLSHWQVNTTADFSGELFYDSGLVSDNGTHLVPFTQLDTVEGTYWWRVRYQTTDGIWSPWSNIVQFAVAMPVVEDAPLFVRLVGVYLFNTEYSEVIPQSAAPWQYDTNTGAMVALTVPIRERSEWGGYPDNPLEFLFTVDSTVAIDINTTVDWAVEWDVPPLPPGRPLFEEEFNEWYELPSYEDELIEPNEWDVPPSYEDELIEPNEWDVPPDVVADSNEWIWPTVVQDGLLLRVTVPQMIVYHMDQSYDTPLEDWWQATLTATATQGATEIGTIVLKLFPNNYYI